ncbi:AAA family ATPase [Candidatus Saccharibacteria bacterium]|nr:AAA family ATPase [Candidatus Saccharibacteria bacterium]
MENNLDYRLNYRANRAIEARYCQRYGKLTRVITLVGAILLSLLGAVLLLAGMAIGWPVLMLAGWSLVPYLWLRSRLRDMPASKQSRNIGDILSLEVLGLLPQDPNPRTIIEALAGSGGAKFLANRLGIPIQQVVQLTPADPGLTESVWRESINIWSHLPERTSTIPSVVVVAAIIRLNPDCTDILNNLRIDADDVYRGVEWLEHWEMQARRSSDLKLTGGIARDWSFGYIPTLEHFGTNLSLKYSEGRRSMAGNLMRNRLLVDDMIKYLSSNARRNVALIGPLGVGKSTVVEALADILMDSKSGASSDVKFNQVFMLDASAIISAANARGEIEQLIGRLLSEAYRAKNIILFLDNAELFMSDGTGSVDLSNLLQPAIEGGGLKLIMAMEEQRFLQIAQAKPALTSALNRIEITPTDDNDTIRVLEDRIIPLEYGSTTLFTYQALTEAYRLSNRYIHDVAQPRASVQLLESAAQRASGGVVNPSVVAQTIEQTLGIKVGGNLQSGDAQAEKDKLLHLEELIHQRMINQTKAVSAVASALRRARAGVRNENRPIGTFLFLGPTGVGKTELAKSLAAVYFSGEDHLVRIDLNEYVRAEDVARLIADGATDPMSLSAQVQKDPFSVVLLDEIEKAHPNVLTTLLQVLDEGVLRDINNRPISFRDTILIATSNAGADKIRQYIEAGYQLEQFSEQIQNELISSGQFKPEFLNRFDEIAVFRPLTKPELLQVIDLILVGINKNLANQKVAVAVDDQAKLALVEAGYDPRLGARPMRRVVQRTVENIVAEKILTGELVPGSGIRLSLADIQASLAKDG